MIPDRVRRPGTTCGIDAWPIATLAFFVSITFVWGTVTAPLRIEVVDPDGAVIADARIVITNDSAADTRTARSGPGGIAWIDGLEPGTYRIQARAAGYSPVRIDGVEIVLETLAEVRVEMPPGVREEVTVRAARKSADLYQMSVGLRLDAGLIDAVPTFREYQDQFQLVPGTGTRKNPRVHGATERDNIYLIDGSNTTDPRDGLIGLEINSEIIEQQVALTGGLGAEYGSAIGLVSNLVTRRGGNDWRGFANFYRRDSDWSAAAADDFDVSTDLTSWEASLGGGGPVVPDRLFFYGSAMKLRSRTRTVTSDGSLRPDGVEDSVRLSGKLTWRVRDDHRLELSFFDSDEEILNSNAKFLRVSPDQFLRRAVPASSLTLRHSAFLGERVVVETLAGRHRQDVDRIPQVPEAGPSVWATGSKLRFGRHWFDNTSSRDRDQFSSDLSYYLPTSRGEHALRAGIQASRTELVEWRAASGGERYFDRTSPGASLWSLFGAGSALLNRWDGFARENAGVTCMLGGVACSEQTAGASTFTDPNDWLLSVDGVNYSPADFLFSEGSINADAAALGWSRYERELALGTRPISPVGNDIWAVYLQDEWRMGPWSARFGLRVERQSMRNSQDKTIHRTDTTYAPRVGLGYDVATAGRSTSALHVAVHWGRFYDPIRDNMVNLAGQLLSPHKVDEIWASPLGSFLAWDSSGGGVTPDTVFAPNFDSPHTDELLVTLALDLGSGSSLRWSGFRRRTREVAETFDSRFGLGDPLIYPELQSGPTLASLGFSDLDGDGTVSEEDAGGRFVIYNPPNSKRDYDGFDLVYNRTLSGGWQLFSSYTYSRDRGNIAGDAFPSPAIGVDPYWDSRLAHNYGPLPGARDHVLRAYGSTLVPLGLKRSSLEIGALVTWMSGEHYSLEGITTPDHGEPGIWNGDPGLIVGTLPVDREAFAAVLGLDEMLPDGSPNPALDAAIVDLMPLDLRAGRGAYENPSRAQIDLRVRYRYQVSSTVKAEFFFDILNLFNRQRPTVLDDQLDATVSQITPENIEDRESYAFQRTMRSQSPRRYFSGVRVTF